MSDDFLENLLTHTGTKDPKGSIRRKYQNRLRRLAYTLDDFILHAEQRLDVASAGRIHKRSEAEAILENCRTLRAVIPVTGLVDDDLPPDVHKNLCDVFGIDPDLPKDGIP